MSRSRTPDGGRDRERMRAEVRDGLLADPPRLPSKYFYDDRGSRLFEEITTLPEYYLTRAERAVLRDRVPSWIASIRARSLVELGAGSAAKTRIILDAMARAEVGDLYVPIDVSGPFLERTAERLRRTYPRLEVRPVVADISAGFDVPADRPRPTLFAFLGSTIGNFSSPAAAALLRRVRRAMAAGDRFLLGVDLRKSRDRLEAAYNDARGITAEFNRNILRVLNRELGADFDPESFEHRAFYSAERHRIEMHLVSAKDQEVTIPGAGRFRFREGESIRTEISRKYDRASVAELFAGAGLELDDWATDPDALFALALGRT